MKRNFFEPKKPARGRKKRKKKGIKRRKEKKRKWKATQLRLSLKFTRKS